MLLHVAVVCPAQRKHVRARSLVQFVVSIKAAGALPPHDTIIAVDTDHGTPRSTIVEHITGNLDTRRASIALAQGNPVCANDQQCLLFLR